MTTSLVMCMIGAGLLFCVIDFLQTFVLLYKYRLLVDVAKSITAVFLIVFALASFIAILFVGV